MSGGQGDSRSYTLVARELPEPRKLSPAVLGHVEELESLVGLEELDEEFQVARRARERSRGGAEDEDLEVDCADDASQR